MNNQENHRLFTTNDVQIQSGDRYNLVNDVAGMDGLVDVLRLSPQSEGRFAWLERFRQARQTPSGAPERRPLPGGDVNGYWHKMAGVTQLQD